MPSYYQLPSLTPFSSGSARCLHFCMPIAHIISRYAKVWRKNPEVFPQIPTDNLFHFIAYAAEMEAPRGTEALPFTYVSFIRSLFPGSPSICFHNAGDVRWRYERAWIKHLGARATGERLSTLKLLSAFGKSYLTALEIRSQLKWTLSVTISTS
jgi:hypothetical protein